MKTTSLQKDCTGLLETDSRGFGFLRSISTGFSQSPSDVFVPPQMITRYRLRPGVAVEGAAEERKGKSPELRTIRTVNGLAPERWADLKEFTQLEVISPNALIRLEDDMLSFTLALHQAGHAPGP